VPELTSRVITTAAPLATVWVAGETLTLPAFVGGGFVGGGVTGTGVGVAGLGVAVGLIVPPPVTVTVKVAVLFVPQALV